MNAAQLIAAVEAALTTLAPVYKGAADESDLYEAALLTVAVDAARLAGGTELITNDGTSAAADITFRRGPGNLWTQGFTYALVTFPNTVKRLEVHLGVKVAGASGVAHECDVCLLESAECDRSRAGGVHPRRTKVIGLIEAKHYVASPGLGVGRGFLGLGTELGGGRCSLAFPCVASANLETLIARKDPECFAEVEPGASAADRLCRHLEQLIRNWLA